MPKCSVFFILALLLLLLKPTFGWFSSVTSPSNTLYPFWGVTEVYQYGKQIESKTYGFTSYTHQTPMPSNAKFPIGSNTKLFTAVAIYQLQERGLLNVTDNIANYLDESDFKAFGYPNETKYCPVLFGDTTNTCQVITFVDLLGMSSGIIRSLNNGYNASSPFINYVWNPCDILWLYNGTISDYVSTFINVPLTFKPTTKYDYSNMNFIFAGYFIEKFSQMKYDKYIQKYILDVIGLTDTYFDSWTGYFGAHLNKVDLWYLMLNENNTSESLGIGWCEPIFSNGVVSSAGGIVSTTNDLIKWYSALFNPNISIPIVFNTSNSLQSLIAPVTVMNEEEQLYYAQGVFVYYNFSVSTTWPRNINYEGSTLCSNTAIQMIPDNKMTIVTAFSNAPRMYIPNGKEGLENIRYNINKNTCRMLINESYSLDDGGSAYVSAFLMEKYDHNP